MKVYVSADMEGVTGVVDAEDVQPPGRDYERGRVLMTEDVNAAVRGAYAAGATAVLVNDAHGPMRNLLPELLDPRARLIKGRPKPMGMMEGLTPEYDAALCVGFHARAGVLGVLSHSYMGHEIEDMWLDDRVTGEIGMFHAAAAAYGVPLALLTGDDAACDEATAWDPAIATVPVKFAKDRFAAQLVPVGEAREAIETTTAAALTDVRLAKHEPGQHTLAVRWQSASVASHLTAIPGVSRRDDRTVVVEADTLQLYRLFNLFLRVCSSVTSNPPYC
ncbi:M55 family metallopeptidase [Kribbella solani]|uniref:M55 family metallopeptidase n=1 Tax=Kribbella solani TaxID=236067 RepID=UPI0029A2A3D4|nr:M55 family metallopeptidase [Kribbella solani]MDX2967624.1 M55 family metallopeptidase [Kribbella solani]MDX3002556.1 M55 family metallopeptidase [Kribbella solani]